MIVEIKEYKYRGFPLYLEPDQGWKIILGDITYLFPHAQAAHAAIDEFHNTVVPKHSGKKWKHK